MDLIHQRSSYASVEMGEVLNLNVRPLTSTRNPWTPVYLACVCGYTGVCPGERKFSFAFVHAPDNKICIVTRLISHHTRRQA